MKPRNAQFTSILIAAVVCIAAVPAHASLIDNGLTYTLTEATTADPQTNQFTLSITGINAATDTEGGRYGVESFALTQPTGYVSATAPTGFTVTLGGLNAGGCDGSGNFFCFYADTVPSGPALAANSSLSFVFNVTATSFLGYVPDFKINWVGTKNNYNLVSLPLAPDGSTPPTTVPEPTILSLLGMGLVGFALVARRRKRS
jgi:hypothetical protein